MRHSRSGLRFGRQSLSFVFARTFVTMVNRLTIVVVLSCFVILGCERTPEEKLKSQIETLVAESKHDTSSDSSRVRSVCTYCGAWKESSPTNIIMSLMEGAEPG